MDDCLRKQASCGKVRGDLQSAAHVAQRSHGVAASGGDPDAAAASSGVPGHDLLGNLARVICERYAMHPSAQEVVEQQIAGDGIVVDLPGNGFAENQVAGETTAGAGRCGLASVVRLQGAEGQDGVGARGLGVCDQVFELARLVATARKPGAVVTLDPQSRAADCFTQAAQRLERRCAVREIYARYVFEAHLGVLS